jgi:hypothetical protein
MAKVLKITKTDKTIHVVPMTNKAFYQAFNNRQPADKRWKLEEIDEKDAKDLPFIDDTHVTPAEAVVKNQKLQNENEAMAERIRALEAQIAANSKQAPDAKLPNGSGQNPSTTTPPQKTALEVIALINAASEVAQVEALIAGDERKTVLDAAEKRKTALAVQ